MPRRHTLPTMIVLACCCAASADDKSARQIRFRNDLTEARQSIFRMTRTIRRTTPQNGYVETLAWRQAAEWVRFQMDESHPGFVKVAQIVADRPAQVMSLFHDADKVEPLPSPGLLGLSLGSTRLYTESMSGTDAPPLLPVADPAQAAVLAALLDVEHWPTDRKRIGDQWQHDLSGGGFAGAQTFELGDVKRVGNETLVTIRMKAAGEFTGALVDQRCKFVSGDAQIIWSSTWRMLKSIQAQASWARGEGASKQEFDLKVDLLLESTRVLDEEAAAAVRKQLIDFSALLDDERAGKPDETLAGCRTFEERWPGSVWLPAVRQLSSNIEQKRSGPRELSEDELREALAKCLVTWQATEAKDDPQTAAQRTKVRKLYEAMANAHRDALLRMAGKADSNSRALAVFALAFGSAPANTAQLERAARDEAGKVRAWAVYGLAVRKATTVDSALLLELLRDEDANVRARACQAVSACVARDSAKLPPLRAQVLDVLLKDRADHVRFIAARTMEEIGTAADVAPLRRALSHEVDQPLRAAIERAIAACERRK